MSNLEYGQVEAIAETTNSELEHNKVVKCIEIRKKH